ncbi:hypothetical protein F4779DRAFT_621787 [Xylariaceae sp. FL0662B]|nr:hypothetical protein F4779DRAFT_621787 [Xylariaceae sp. FL0662B]
MSSTVDSEGLSVLNVSPHHILGPDLLHDVISTASSSKLPAIDYLSSSNDRVIVSYSELHAAAAVLATRITAVLSSLVRGGVQEQLVIPVLIPQSPALYISLLAILKVGGAFCPLNLDAPKERVKFILKDVGARVILASSEFVSKIPVDGDDGVSKVISIDQCLDTGASNLSQEASFRKPQADDLAYVMYTSGSTGTPKGVGISHKAATQSLLAHDRHIPSFSRFLQFAAPTFDVSVFEIFFPLFRGSTIVCCGRAEMLSDLPGVLRRMEVDACELTPSVAGSLLKSRSNAPGLRLLLTIGEMLTEPIIQEFGGDDSRDSMLWGMYGPTEATIHCTLQPAFSRMSAKHNIGIPLDTVSAFVVEFVSVDAAMPEFKVIPVGEVGELAVGGSQLATGYINRPEQTAAVFVDTRWGRVYRTGDKAMMQPDGTIECLGRIDDAQVKLNGQRIELGEVEHALLRTPGCHGAFATVVSNVLVAFAAVEDVPGIHDTILAKCKSWLPSFMVPAEIKTMEHFPRLPSGKVDKKALIKQYEASTSHDQHSEDQFEHPLERQLCEIAGQILSQRIVPSTYLPSLGLDSLAAIQYAAALRAVGVAINPIDVLDASTVRELLHAIENRQNLAEASYANETSVDQGQPTQLKKILESNGDIEAHSDNIQRVEACTPLQESMIAETLKDARLYINQTELHFPGHVVVESIRSWFFILAERNEILRTGFSHLGHRLFQLIWKRLETDQIQVVSCANPFKCIDVELFLRRPFKVEIVPGQVPSDWHTVRLTLHHSIYDGWTMDLLVEDFSLLALGYQPIDRIQFRKVSQYLTSTASNASIEAKEFWAEHLRGYASMISPNFRTTAIPNPQIMTTTKKIRVDPKIAKDFALQLCVGPSVIFQACLGWLWATINGVGDTVLGSVSSGRALPVSGIENIMGPCIATLPLRIALSQFRTITELLQGIHETNRQILRHSGLPPTEIKRAAGITPAQRLFDIIFAYQETLASRRQSYDVVREVRHLDTVEAKLLIEICPLEGHFSCQMTWHSDVYSQPQVDIFYQHLDCLVNHFIRHHTEALERIPRCFPVQNLSWYNKIPKNIEVFPTLSRLVEKTASLFPDHAALCFAFSTSVSDVKLQTLTYHELNSKANKICRYLQASGVTPGGAIAIVMEKSPLLYCSILGILKAGCAYLPILPSTPLQRIQLILKQAQPQVCLVDGTSHISEAASCIVIDICSVILSDYTDANLEIHGDPSQLAYVIYTSGTTGSPKGVSVTNGNMLSNIEVLSRVYPYDPSGRMLQACSQAFDVSVFEIFFAWANGMCLCSATNDTLFEDLGRAIRVLEITHLSMTVTVASLIEPSQVPSVRFLVTSGEPMTDKVLDTWAKYLWQGYGPSETTNICTVRKIAPGDSSQYLGWCLENTSAFVFFPGTTNLVPLGCVGELCFGGDQVASGYLKMPEMTAAKFFEHHEYGRLYRSGDLGRMLPDGSLIILGRIDTQVKLRGLRIELQEIQAVVLRSGLAKTCASVLTTVKSNTVPQLALFYVPINHESIRCKFLPLADSVRQTIIELQHILQAALPDYMVPSFIFPISALPLTSSGKVDYDLLRQSIAGLSDRSLSICSSAEEHDFDSPEWTETERSICEAIAGTLGIDEKVISRWSSFATFGIDSISAMPLARKLQTVFRKRMPLSLILQNPTVGRLASAITRDGVSMAAQVEADTLLPKQLTESVQQHFIDQGMSVETVLPCTPLQEAMLSASPSSRKGASYSNQMLFRLRVSSVAMMKNWGVMFERHGILRTCFMLTEDAQFPIVQVILESYSPIWKTFEADHTTLQQRLSEHMSSLEDPFDSSQPPVSLALIRLKDSTEYISFICHHAIYDGVSMRNLLSEIESTTRHEQLPAPPSFELFLRKTLRLPPGTNDFWAEHFHSFSPTLFNEATFHPDPDSVVMTSKTLSRSLSSVTIRLRDLGISMLPLCQAAWAITVSLLQGTSDICIGNVVSGRSITMDKIDTLVAPCFNTVPIRMSLSHPKFLLEAMRRFQQLNAKMLPYQFTSLRRIQSQLPSSPRLFDTLLILQPPSEPLDETIWSLEQDNGAMDIPLVCEVIPSKERDNITLQLHRDPSYFTHDFLLLIVDILQHVFDVCLEHPSSHIMLISELPLQWQEQIGRLSLSQDTGRVDTNATAAHVLEPESWTETEMRVRSVLSRLVKFPEAKVERNTPIYRYGLDSIGAVQLAALLRREACTVSAIDVIENPTCAGIASHMIIHDSNEDGFAYDFDRFRDTVYKDLGNVEGLTKDLEAILPCTPTQQGMISRFLSSEGTHYFNYVSWKLEVVIDPHQVAEAWVQLAIRHQILRTGFVPVNHQDTSYAMTVYPKVNFHAPISILQPSSFDVQKWRIASASNALQTLSKPPWQVSIVDDACGLSTMHLAIHHALYDEISLRLLLRDLADIVSGVELSEPASIQSIISRSFDPMRLQSASETFWKGKSEILVVNKFPTMTPLHVTGRSASTTSRICSISSDILRRSAAEASITVQAALQAAWTRMLSAYLGESSVTFGVVLDGRISEEERVFVFPMVTTLPVIAQDSDSNAELLEYMMKYNTALRRHERTPLPTIQRWLGRPDAQLFDTIIVFQQADSDADSLPWTVSDEFASIEYSIALELVELASSRFQLNLKYDTGILPTEQADILLKQFDAIFVGLLVSPQSHSKDLCSLLSSLFSILPATHQQLPSRAELLHQLVEQTAKRSPTTVALEFVEEINTPIQRRSWTYRELDEMGNQVANLLIGQDIPPGSIIAACFNKCPEAYFSTLGILKAGCAFLSLDPSAPISRLEFILHDSAAACLLIEAGLTDDICLNASIPVYEVSEPKLERFPPALQPSSIQISPSDTCYCLYTSGTTGTPKGCLISHGNAVQAMLAFEQLFAGHWDTQSRWLQFASFHFDVSVLEQYCSWLVGITVVAAPKDLILSDLTATISRLDITHIDLTPSLARLVHPDEVPKLCSGVFITGGEQLRQEILHTWGPKQVIYNAYGPTEATIGVTMFQRVPANGKSSNIGQLFPNVGAYIFQPGSEIPVLRGGVGELCVSGRLVGKGYLNRHQLTAERFPILKQYGERVYRTGDLVRVLYDGSLDFLGRADDQVKLRGQRLEIGEINHAIKDGLLNRLADVATFVARHLDQDRDLLVSFVAPAESLDIPGDLRILFEKHHLELSQTALEACKDRLPGYMVPTYVFCAPYIPLSSNNKADVNCLKKLFNGLPYDQLRNLTVCSAGSQRSLNEKEELISMAVSAVAPVENTTILPSSSIFELGIDSINVAQLARNLQSHGFISASPSIILRHPQISRLSQALQQANTSALAGRTLQVKQHILALYHRHVGMACRVLGADKSDVEYIAPCTPLQEGMLTRSKSSETQSAYFNQFQIDLDPCVSISRLKDCWRRTINAFSILRTAFLATTEGYIQVSLKRKTLRWFEVKTQEDEIQDFIADRRQSWIRSNQDTLRYPIEVDHFEHSGKQVLLVRLSHAIYDGHSFELLLRDVTSNYRGDTTVRGPAFIDVLPYGPLLSYNQSKPFWEALFKNRPVQPIPSLTDKPGTSDTFVSRIFRVDALESRRKALGVTHQTVLQAAWLVALQQRLGFMPTLGVVFSGRSLTFNGVEDVIGPMFNTLPFRVEDVIEATWASFIHKVQEYNTTVLGFVHTPLRDIQKWCSNGRPLFNTLFTFNREDVFPSEENRPFWTSIQSQGVLDYPLSLEIILSRDQSFKVTAAAHRDSADEAVVSLLLDNFIQALTALATSSGDSRLPVKHKIENAANGTFNSQDVPRLPSAHSADTGTSEFVWTDQAREVRRELTSLSQLADEDIVETTSIYELGLDSIDAIKLVSRLIRLGFKIALSDLMKKPTIKDIILSQDAAGIKVNGSKPTPVLLHQHVTLLRTCLIREGKDFPNVEAILPPTPLQDSMVADMLLSRFRRYFNHDVLEVLPDTDIDRLKAAWQTVYANSPILRTTFVEIDDPDVDTAFCQVVRDSGLRLDPTAELSSLEEIGTVFDCARERAVEANGTSDLVQVSFVKTTNNHYMVLSIAHALYDGWSLELIHQDVHAAYDDQYNARGNYEPYLSRILFSPQKGSEDFWADFLHDAHPTTLSQVHSLPEDHEPVIHRSEAVSALTPQEFKVLCRNFRITPQVLAQGCWSAVLASLSKSLDVIFGVVLSGRDTDEAQSILFPTMNTVPMRIVLHGTVTEYFSYLHDTMSDVMEFQHLPLRQVQKLARHQGDKLFNTLFLLQNAKKNRTRKDRPIYRSVYASSAVEYPVCIEMELTEDSVVWHIAGDERYVSLQDTQQVLRDLETVLRHFAKGDHAEVIEFHPTSGEVSVCGLNPFTIASSPEQETRAMRRNPVPQDIESFSVESPIMEVLATLSGINRHDIDLNHSIYHLGLDSISAIKASSMLRKRGVSISVRDMLKAASIRDIQSKLTGSVNHSDNRASNASLDSSMIFNTAEIPFVVNRIGIDPDTVEKVLPALPMQVYMLSFWQNTDGLLCFPRFTFRVSGTVDRQRISKAWFSLVAKTPVLRTYLATTTSEEVPFVQIITRAKSINSTSLIGFEEGKWEFVDTTTPLAFIRAGNLHSEEVYLHLYIHHALYDAISLPIMLRHLSELCDGRSAPSFTAHQSTWYEFVSKHSSSDIQHQRRKFWTSYFEGVTVMHLPLEKQLPTEGRKTQQVEEFRRDAISNVSRLKNTSSTHGVTVQALFFAAYSKVLANLCAENSTKNSGDDVVFGIYLANRTSFPGLEEVPCPTLNIVPLVVRKPLAKSIVTLAAVIQKDLFEVSSFANASVGLWEIYNWTGLQVETFVNFLTPSDSFSDATNGTVSITKVPEAFPSVPGSVDSPSQLAQADAEFMSQNRARGSFVHAIDIEVAIHGDAMDIGVFCPSPPFQTSKASEMVESIVATLEAM